MANMDHFRMGTSTRVPQEPKNHKITIIWKSNKYNLPEAILPVTRRRPFR